MWIDRWAALVVLLSISCDAKPPPPANNVTETRVTAQPPSQAPKSEQGEAAGVHYLVRYTADGAPGQMLTMVVAIHGLGDRPERFGLLRGYPGRARVILPRGLTSYGSGYSWFPIDEDDPAEAAAAARHAVDSVAAMIDVLRRRFPTLGTPVVTGFSQGGMLSFGIAAKHPTSVQLALPVSGLLPTGVTPSAVPADTPSIVALHGDADNRVDIQRTRRDVVKLQQAGFSAQLIEYPGVTHTVSAAMRRELYRRLAVAATTP